MPSSRCRWDGSLPIYGSTEPALYKEIQLDLFLDYASNVKLCAKFQEYFRKSKPPLIAIWGKNDPYFIPAGAEVFRKDMPAAKVQLFDTGHSLRQEAKIQSFPHSLVISKNGGRCRRRNFKGRSVAFWLAQFAAQLGDVQIERGSALNDPVDASPRKATTNGSVHQNEQTRRLKMCFGLDSGWRFFGPAISFL